MLFLQFCSKHTHKQFKTMSETLKKNTENEYPINPMICVPSTIINTFVAAINLILYNVCHSNILNICLYLSDRL